jgi:HAE1 family hydrophobic/amphiphilic exporter-1
MFPLWNFFLKRKQFSTILIVGLVALGLYCVALIPKEASPTINIPVGNVTVTFPGASAEDVESLVTNPLEEQIVNIGDIDTLTSTSKDGVSSIRVQFDANADINQSIQSLEQAVAKVVPQLPSEINTPTVGQVNYNDRPILSISVSGDLPQTQLATLGQTLTTDLEGVQGVSSVSVSGIPVPEVDVVVDKNALATQGLRLTDVITAIANSNASLPAGNITMTGVNYDVDFKGNITDPNQIGDIALTNKNGATIYLRDIALISNGLASATTYSRVSVSGAPANQAMTLLVYEQTGGNVTIIANAVKAEMKSLQETSLAGLTVLIAPSTDQGVQVSTQLGALVDTGCITILLIIAILFLTIGWRESIVAALSIPLSFTIAFAGLYFGGFTLNLISLFALILAVGILVDSGIVITEAIHARMNVYGSTLEAARVSLKEYGWPLIAGTMTTVAVFVPLMYLTGTTGRFISNVPATIIIVLIASIFVALGIVPLIATMFTNLERNALEKKQEEYTAKIQIWYVKKLRILLENRRHQNIFIWILVVLFVAAIILPLRGYLPVSFFPQTNQDYVYVNIQKPPGTDLAMTDLSTREVEELLYTDKDIASFVTAVGASSSFGGSSNSSSGSNQANITVNLYPGHKKSSTQVQAELSKLLSPIKDTDIQVLQPSSGPGSGAPIQIQFTGNNLNELVAAADTSAQYLSTVPGVSNITTTTKNNGTEFVLTINRAKATALGLTESEIAQILRAAVNGSIATTIDQPLQNINVVVKLDLNPNYTDPSNTNQTTMDSIDNISIQTPSGSVLLGSILSDSLGNSNASIAHLNEQRIETISAYPTANTTAGVVVTAFQKGLPSLHFPSDVVVSYGGDAQSISQSFGQLFICLIVGLLAMFMILILAFNSIHDTIQLLLLIPLSLIGILFGLTITHQTLSFPVFLGFVALGGVIVNHAIILTDSMVKRVKAEPDKAKIDITLEAASSRLRPIFLTTATTVIGMIPLEISGGEFGPLAFTVMFGLSFAICLTLVLLPVLFYRSEIKKERKIMEKAQGNLST